MRHCVVLLSTLVLSLITYICFITHILTYSQHGPIAVLSELQHFRMVLTEPPMTLPEVIRKRSAHIKMTPPEVFIKQSVHKNMAIYEVNIKRSLYLHETLPEATTEHYVGGSNFHNNERSLFTLHNVHYLVHLYSPILTRDHENNFIKIGTMYLDCPMARVKRANMQLHRHLYMRHDFGVQLRKIHIYSPMCTILVALPCQHHRVLLYKSVIFEAKTTTGGGKGVIKSRTWSANELRTYTPDVPQRGIYKWEDYTPTDLLTTPERIYVQIPIDVTR